MTVAEAQWQPDVQLTFDGNPARIWANNGWCLVTAPDSTLQAVWWEGRDGHPEVYGKRSTDAGLTWEPDQNLSPDPDSSFCPSLAAIGGDIYLAYKDKRDSWSVTCRRSTDAGATWSAETTLAGFASAIGGCVTSAASDSFVHVLWAVFHGSHTQVSYRRSLDRGITWQPEVLLTHDTARSEDPAVAVSGSNVHVVWFDTRNGPGDAYYERSTDHGATWGPETRLTSDAAIVYAPTVAAVDSLVHVAWIDRRSGDYHFQVYYMRSTDAGTTWQPEARLCDNPGKALFPVLAASGRNIHVAWYDDRTGSDQLYYRRSTDRGETWEPELQLTQTSGNSGNPAIALAGEAVHVIWCCDSSGDTEIYYKSNPTGNAGLEEDVMPQAARPIQGATIVRGVLFMSEPETSSELHGNSVMSRAALVDATGRPVLRLRPGANDLQRLPPGVYFVRKREARAVLKVVLLN